jgi:hypothetical protein
VIRTRVEEYSIEKLFVERVHWYDLSAAAFRVPVLLLQERFSLSKGLKK